MGLTVPGASLTGAARRYDTAGHGREQAARTHPSDIDRRSGVVADRSCDFTAHMCTGIIHENYKLFVNPLFKLISIEHVIIGSKTQWKTM